MFAENTNIKIQPSSINIGHLEPEDTILNTVTISHIDVLEIMGHNMRH